MFVWVYTIFLIGLLIGAVGGYYCGLKFAYDNQE